jgi:hypothetical protein
MMANPDSDDYELMPRQELEDLRRQVSTLKKDNLTEGDKAKILIESMDRLTISINRLITILDDAEADIIEEYQQSKPAERLNQLAEQNDAIAKALLALSETFGGGSDHGSRNILPSSSYSDMPTMPQPPIMGSPRNTLPPLSESHKMSSRSSMNPGPSSMSPMDDMPPMESMPPLDGQPMTPKKKFLGIM